MRVILCDECKKEIQEKKVVKIYLRSDDEDRVLVGMNVKLHEKDFCKVCACKIINNLIKEEVEEKPEKCEEKEEVKTEIKEEGKKKTKTKDKKTNDEEGQQNETKKIDWDKACALKNAGWTNEKIADELGAKLSTIRVNIYKHLRKFNGERE